MAPIQGAPHTWPRKSALTLSDTPSSGSKNLLTAAVRVQRQKESTRGQLRRPAARTLERVGLLYSPFGEVNRECQSIAPFAQSKPLNPRLTLRIAAARDPAVLAVEALSLGAHLHSTPLPVKSAGGALRTGGVPVLRVPIVASLGGAVVLSLFAEGAWPAVLLAARRPAGWQRTSACSG